MKTILTLSLLFVSLLGNAQTYEVYEYTNGIPDPYPSQIIETQTTGEINIYSTTLGIPDPVPSKVLIPTNTGVEVYETNNGLQNIVPEMVILQYNRSELILSNDIIPITTNQPKNAITSTPNQ